MKQKNDVVSLYKTKCRCECGKLLERHSDCQITEYYTWDPDTEEQTMINSKNNDTENYFICPDCEKVYESVDDIPGLTEEEIEKLEEFLPW